MNDFMNGMMSGLGFMSGVGMYNTAFQMGYQKEMIKQQQKQTIADMIANALQDEDYVDSFSGIEELCPAIYEHLLEYYPEKLVKEVITENFDKENARLFWNKGRKAEPWRVY